MNTKQENNTVTQCVQQACKVLLEQRQYPPRHILADVLVVSVSDGLGRAKVKTVWLDQVPWQIADLMEKVVQVMQRLEEKFVDPLSYLRLEWVTNVHTRTWGEMPSELSRYKRNYFRSGLAFAGVREPWLLLTEMELNANACLYTGNDRVSAEVNQVNLERYLKARHGSSQMPDFAPEREVLIFQTAGVFADLQTGQVHELSTVPRYQGHRHLPDLDLPLTQELIDLAAHYLARQVQQSGQYEYGHFPCFGRNIPTYNMLRHVSSTYALIEGYEALQMPSEHLPPLSQVISHQRATPESLQQMRAQIDAALAFLLQEGVRRYGEKAYVVERNGEIKLGANAVAILALVKYLTVFPEHPMRQDYLALCEQFALGIVAMQRENGRFVHVLNADDLSVKAEQRIIYYDGEAAFGLMRLYGLTQDRRWLDCVVRAFDYFIENKHEKAHDHWLSYCSNELVKYLPEEKYFAFAVRNVQGYVDFIKNRITTFPTLLELSIAFHQMLLKLDQFPEFRKTVLAGFDVTAFYEALHQRAHYLINGFFFPEVAMFFHSPQTILHGLFIRHHGFRVRIDDVEHYLSGLIGYHNLLADGRLPESLSIEKVQTKEAEQTTSVEPLTRLGLLAAIPGAKWLVRPSENWSASGLCVWPKNFKPGFLLVARGKNMEQGYLPSVTVNALAKRGAVGVITDDEHYQLDADIPVLWVKDIRRSVLAIGKATRRHFAGRVVGITGSAGKTTTVAMMAHTLSAQLPTSQTMGSANLPIGIAWNMASMPAEDTFWVLEMAIGNMQLNSELVQPDVAVITNIAPAHLEYHHDVETIADKKSRIFNEMKEGSLAVLCRDMDQFDRIAAVAVKRRLNVVTYGEHADANIRLLSYAPEGAEILLADGSQHRLHLAAAGKHQALNALAVLAVVQHFGLNIEQALAALGTFQAVSGRGVRFYSIYADKAIEVIDDAYNANPLSMAASLAQFA